MGFKEIAKLHPEKALPLSIPFMGFFKVKGVFNHLLFRSFNSLYGVLQRMARNGEKRRENLSIPFMGFHIEGSSGGLGLYYVLSIPFMGFPHSYYSAVNHVEPTFNSLYGVPAAAKSNLHEKQIDFQFPLWGSAFTVDN